ncbi:MAG: hypothetical protein ACR2GY_12985 [Phycisphaerales bacterium]
MPDHDQTPCGVGSRHMTMFAVVVSVCTAVITVAALLPSLDKRSADPTSAAGPTNSAWTAVGSTGVVDEASLPVYDLAKSVTRIHPDAGNTAELSARYNVTPTEQLVENFGFTMTVVYRDNSPAANIIARLRRYDAFSNTTQTILTFDSNLFPDSDLYQAQAVSGSFAFDFENFAYYVDVELSKLGASGRPELASLQIR